MWVRWSSSDVLVIRSDLIGSSDHRREVQGVKLIAWTLSCKIPHAMERRGVSLHRPYCTETQSTHMRQIWRHPPTEARNSLPPAPSRFLPAGISSSINTQQHSTFSQRVISPTPNKPPRLKKQDYASNAKRRYFLALSHSSCRCLDIKILIDWLLFCIVHARARNATGYVSVIPVDKRHGMMVRQRGWMSERGEVEGVDLSTDVWGCDYCTSGSIFNSPGKEKN